MNERRGIWRPLENPWIYEAFHHAIGARRWLRRFATETVNAKAGDVVIDIGCGPGALLRYLSDVSYIGLDHNEAYIERGSAEFGSRGTFICGDIANFNAFGMPRADIAVAIGVLHHLDDDLAASVLKAAYETLNPGGRLIAADPCFHPDQDALQHFVVSRDRGMHVRPFERYAELCASAFEKPVATFTQGYSPFPYSVCILQAARPCA